MPAKHNSSSLFIILPILIATCSYKQPAQQPEQVSRFTLPVIIQKEKVDTVKALNINRMIDIFPPFVGRFKMGDTVDVTRPEKQFLTEKEYLWEQQHATESDSLSSDGLQVIPDYKTSVAYAKWMFPPRLYYPVYIVNETAEPKYFFGKDSHGFAIQEAIDTADRDNWHPIECQGYDFCGNGGFGKKIDPGYFVVLLLPKYAGTDTTSLRVRLKIGESIFISKAFTGVINPAQFNIDKEDWMYSRLKETKGAAAQWLFYGGWPKGDWE